MNEKDILDWFNNKLEKGVVSTDGFLREIYKEKEMFLEDCLCLHRHIIANCCYHYAHVILENNGFNEDEIQQIILTGAESMKEEDDGACISN